MEKKKEAVKLEGLQVVGKKESNNPKKEIEKVYTSPVKIGDKKYIIKRLSMLDIRKLNLERKKVKENDDMATYDFSFYTLLSVIKKYNPETKNLTVEEFEDMIDIIEFEEVQKAILQISGLDKYFKPGDSKK